MTPGSARAARSHSSDETAREMIRSAGLRVTPQRLAVFAALQRAAGAHLSAEDVWQRLRRGPAEMDKSTAYRVLADLAEIGLLKQVRLGDGLARFEIQDVAHHHAVCTRCGVTEDVSVESVTALGRRLHAATGFVLGEQSLLLPGLCAACSSQRSV